MVIKMSLLLMGMALSALMVTAICSYLVLKSYLRYRLLPLLFFGLSTLMAVFWITGFIFLINLNPDAAYITFANLYIKLSVETIFTAFFFSYFGIIFCRHTTVPKRTNIFSFFMGFQMLAYPFFFTLQFSPIKNAWLFTYTPWYFQAVYVITGLLILIEILAYFILVKDNLGHENRHLFLFFVIGWCLLFGASFLLIGMNELLLGLVPEYEAFYLAFDPLHYPDMWAYPLGIIFISIPLWKNPMSIMVNPHKTFGLIISHSESGLELFSMDLQKMVRTQSDLYSGAMFGVTSIIQEITTDKTNPIRYIDQGKSKILIEQGRKVTAFLITQGESQNLRTSLRTAVGNFETKYSKQLKKFNADTKPFEPFEEDIKVLFGYITPTETE